MGHVKSRLFETYHREYKNFVQLIKGVIDSMFPRFRAQSATFPMIIMREHSSYYMLSHEIVLQDGQHKRIEAET